ncbi:MAG: hypothetical protein LBB98_14045 [Treponema sp.]|jgi:hypothetical protein|nr:hypothetical protein [Treponema sp.]
MAKVSDQEHQLYFEKTAPYQATIEAILNREKKQLLVIPKSPADAALKRIALVEDMLNLASHYIILNGVSLSVLKVKNEDALNEARKSIYKSVIYLEQVVTGFVDAGFSEYEDKTAEIASMDSFRRYLLVRKTGLAIQFLERAYGDNTKWKWSFVELEGRYAAVAKNILDMKNAVMNTDPRSSNYEPTMYHLRLVWRLLSQAADRYREKYELSTNRPEDCRLGIDFLCALKRIFVAMGDREEAEVIQKKIDIWSLKLESDIRKHQEILQKEE